MNLAKDVRRFTNEVRRYSRLALGLSRLARVPRVTEPLETLRRDLENREPAFLDLAARAIYAKPENPFHRMLKLAQCEYADLERALRCDGLDKTLQQLLRAGVYLTHDELKGKQPIIRSGEVIPANEHSYDNPTLSPGVELRSSGSRSGGGTQSQHSVAAELHLEQYNLLLAHELGTYDRGLVAMLPILPSPGGLLSAIRGPLSGWHTAKWFAVGGHLQDSGHYRALTAAMVVVARLSGSRCKFPTYLPQNDFSPVAEYLAREKAAGRSCVVGGFVSPAVRIAAIAAERGLDISGTIFSVAGEALTPAKRAVIEATSCEVYPFYIITEVGIIGYACSRMKTGNCVHVTEDSVAVIARKRPAPFSETEVNSLMFTTLAPFASRALINSEMDDSGIIEDINCDCVFGQIGFRRQIRDIASYGKLTGQGMTLIGTDVVQVLEEALPRRLGGGPGDYQLVEEEGEGQTNVTLRVSPRVANLNPEKVRACFLEELKRHYGGALAARTWSHAEGVKVTIAEPFTTSTGKVLSLHLLGNQKPARRVA